MKLYLSAKCSDLCWLRIDNDDGEPLLEHDGYVPDFMPGQHWGDYIDLEIDVETGVILNWKPNEVRAAINKEVKCTT